MGSSLLTTLTTDDKGSEPAVLELDAGRYYASGQGAAAAAAPAAQRYQHLDELCAKVAAALSGAATAGGSGAGAAAGEKTKRQQQADEDEKARGQGRSGVRDPDYDPLRIGPPRRPGGRVLRPGEPSVVLCGHSARWTAWQFLDPANQTNRTKRTNESGEDDIMPLGPGGGLGGPLGGPFGPGGLGGPFGPGGGMRDPFGGGGGGLMPPGMGGGGGFGGRGGGGMRDPFGGGMGGMHVGPDHPYFADRMRHPDLGPGGIAGGRGAHPPGSRWDPISE
jgi:hypothetical protein